jgi:Tfp pilus assembly protein PilE
MRVVIAGVVGVALLVAAPGTGRAADKELLKELIEVSKERGRVSAAEAALESNRGDLENYRQSQERIVAQAHLVRTLLTGLKDKETDPAEKQSYQRRIAQALETERAVERTVEAVKSDQQKLADRRAGIAKQKAELDKRLDDLLIRLAAGK